MQKVICRDIYGKTHEASMDQLSWRPSVYGILIVDDRVLMAKQYSKYGLPGGGMDFGEQPEHALLREFIEETGLTIKDIALQSVQSDMFKLPHVANDGFIQSIQLFYRCNYDNGELSTDGFEDHETVHAELAEWVPLSRLDQIETYGTPDFIGEIRKVWDSYSAPAAKAGLL